MRVVCAYGVTDRHGADGARRGLAENERFLRAGGRGMVGVHAAFTCTDETLEAAAGLAADLGVGVHIHVAEGPADVERGSALGAARRATTGCSSTASLLDRPLPGTIAHNPRSNMNNAVGYGRPARAAERRRARHRRHRRRHARGVPPRLRRPPRRRRAGRAGHGVELGDQRLPLHPRVRRRPSDVDATTTSTRRGTSRSRPASAPPTSSAATARCSSPAACRPASTSPRSAPTPPSKRSACSPASEAVDRYHPSMPRHRSRARRRRADVAHAVSRLPPGDVRRQGHRLDPGTAGRPACPVHDDDPGWDDQAPRRRRGQLVPGRPARTRSARAVGQRTVGRRPRLGVALRRPGLPGRLVGPLRRGVRTKPCRCRDARGQSRRALRQVRRAHR